MSGSVYHTVGKQLGGESLESEVMDDTYLFFLQACIICGVFVLPMSTDICSFSVANGGFER
jgi:hypothetical protein